MRRIILGALFLLLCISPVLAGVSVEFSIYPEILLPGDYADCTIKLINTGASDVKVYSVVIQGQVEPRQFYNIGTIPAGGSYTLPFSIKADKVGRYNVEVKIYTENETVTQNIMIVVDDKFPSLAIESPIHLGEINNVKFFVSSPVELKDVKVEALFNATPRVVYLGTISGKAEGYLKFFADSKQPLRFKLTFYNGRNYHEVIKELHPIYIKSKGVLLNVTAAYALSYIGDCIPISVEIANLRGDNIYNITVTLSSKLGTFSDDVAKIAEIKSGESKNLEFVYSPKSGGEDSISVTVSYSDEFGNRYESKSLVRIKVLDSLALSLTNIETMAEGFKTRISADISNNGRSEVYNVYAIAVCGDKRKDYFVGNIDPSDFQSFDLALECNETIKIIVTWSNELGEHFELSKLIEAESPSLPKPDSKPLIIAAAAAIIVFAIVAYVIYRQIRK